MADEDGGVDYSKLFGTLALGLSDLTASFTKYMQSQAMAEKNRKDKIRPSLLPGGDTDSLFADPLGLTDKPTRRSADV